MNLRCPACQAALRLKEDRLPGRGSARCPRCGASVPLDPTNAAAPASLAGAAGDEPLQITCEACHARLRAPSAKLGTTSRCPRCGEPVRIEAPSAAGVQDEPSGAATRRIDSRALGVRMGASAGAVPRAEVDLDDFLKPTSASPAREPEPDTGIASELMRPRVGQMAEAARDIKDAAIELGARTVQAPARPPGQAASPTAATRSQAAPVERAEPARPKAQAPPAPEFDRAYPAGRGLFAGCIAGLLVGGAWTAVEFEVAGAPLAGLASWVAPLPELRVLAAVPPMIFRLGIPALLGGLAGFVAAAAGSPSSRERPLSMKRCGGAGLLAGLAAGLLATVSSPGGFDSFNVWPALNWMRDLLAVGLLTPALNRLFPSGTS